MQLKNLLITAVSTVLLNLSFSATAMSDQTTSIKTVNGVGQYPENYEGTPHRDPLEDPFISPSNSALVLIDYQPHVLMGVNSIDHEELMNHTIALITSAAHFDIPIILSRVGVGYNGTKPFLEELTKWL